MYYSFLPSSNTCGATGGFGEVVYASGGAPIKGVISVRMTSVRRKDIGKEAVSKYKEDELAFNTDDAYLCRGSN
jgi:hypothetical protein